MKLDSGRIKAEREKRAWSQEHLAEVAGVALRTIQRVEATGSGSYETVRAIAAVLELDVAALRAAEASMRVAVRAKARYIAAAIALVFAVSVFFVRSAFAGQVMLEIGLSLNDERLSQHRMITDDGKSAEIRLERQLRMVVVPAATDVGVMLSLQLYEFSGSDFELVATPKLLALDNEDAEVRLTSSKGSVIRIVIKPHKI